MRDGHVIWMDVVLTYSIESFCRVGLIIWMGSVGEISVRDFSVDGRSVSG